MTCPVPPVDFSALIAPERVLVLPCGIGKQEALERLAATVSADPRIRDPFAFLAAILERETVSSTGIGDGVAIPHVKSAAIRGTVVGIGLAPDGIDFGASDGRPVQLMVMIAAGDGDNAAYLRLLASVAAQLKQPALRESLIAARSAAELTRLLA